MQDRTAPTPRRIHVLLALLLAVSLGLRLWYAAPEPHSGRNWDERFGFQNVSHLLISDDRPRNAFYPSLSYLPQAAVLAASEALHRATGVEALAIRAETANGWSPTAYRLARGCVALFGVLGMLATYAAGRRLFSPAVGLLAAAFLGAFSRHLVSSSHFKPDTLAVFLTALALYVTIPAARRPTLRRFLAAGAAVGLAVSAKYTAVASALPLAAAVLFRLLDRTLGGGRRGPRRQPGGCHPGVRVRPAPDLRQAGWLMLAGLTSIAVFVALNPNLPLVFRFSSLLVHGYARRGESAGTGHLSVLRQQLALLLSDHGWPVAVLLVLGTLGLAARALRRGAGEEERVDAVLLLGGFLGYTALHAGFMTFFRAQNYLPAVVFSSLIAAWAGVELWRALLRRLPARAARPATAAAMAVAAVLPVGRQVDWVYHQLMPSTWQLAEKLLEAELAPLGPSGLRHVVYEPDMRGRRLILDWNERALATPVRRLADAPAALLDGSDAEVFPRRRLEGPEGELYLRRGLAVGQTRIRRVESRRFHSHGEPLVVYLHPWRALGPAEELPVATLRRRLVARLPGASEAAGLLGSAEARPALSPGAPAPPGTALSFVLWVPLGKRPGAGGPLFLRPGGERFALRYTGQRERKVRLATMRAPAPAGAGRVELPTGNAPPDAYRLVLHRWESPWEPQAALAR